MKLIVDEKETPALWKSIEGWPKLASSELLIAEVTRAVLRVVPSLISEVSVLLRDVNLIAVTRQRLQRATFIEPRELRTVDALHLATALTMEARLAALYTYDHRMMAAAQRLGLTVLAPD